MAIHPTAVVDPTAEIDGTAEIGPYVIIEKEAKIGAATVVMAHAVIGPYTEIGEQNEIHYGAMLGNDPQDISFKREWKTYLKIGSRNILREHCSIHRGSIEGAATVIGDDNYFMAYMHIGHDCTIGSHVIIGTFAAISGHVEIQDSVNISGLSGLHQFIRVGELAFISGVARIGMDVPPYMIARGDSEVIGPNIEGLKRAEFSQEKRNIIKKTYRILYRSGLNVSQALEKLEGMRDIPEVHKIVEFIQSSERGICRTSKRSGR